MLCNLCGSNTLIEGTLLVYTTYRCEDKDYIPIEEEGRSLKAYFEIIRYCPACYLKYCLGAKNKSLSQENGLESGARIQ